jgi:signal transduction histidine kinase/FixJ family two-component response regulator
MGDRILIVDDEPTVLTFCTRALARMGYEVQGASSGADALNLLKTGLYQVLVTDIAMPGMTGIELLDVARQLQPDLAVIVITGVGSIDLAIKALRGGAQDFLPKPFTPLELKGAVDHALAEVHTAQERARMNVILPLFELTKRRLDDVDLKSLYREILRLAVEQTKANSAALFALGEGGDCVHLEAVVGAEMSCEEACLTLIRLAREREEAFVLDLVAAESLGIRLDMEAHGVIELLCAPLHVPGRFAGALLLTKGIGQSSFRSGDVGIVTILSTQVAGLVENARLVSKLGGWNRELERRVAERTHALEQANQRLLRSERLATVGKLGAGIAHELRNPLGVINNSAYYLRTRLGEDDPKIARHLDIVEREVQTANKIITDLMAFVRVTDLETAPVDVNALVHEALTKVDVPENVQVETRLDDSIPKPLLDAGQMRQVLINLMNNAIQAMPDGGELSISTTGGNGGVTLAVQDTGAGIELENMDRMFEPLFTTKAKGIGLGLALVKLLVEAHQGEVDVTSQEGRGTVFTVRIPLKPVVD